MIAFVLFLLLFTSPGKVGERATVFSFSLLRDLVVKNAEKTNRTVLRPPNNFVAFFHFLASPSPQEL